MARSADRNDARRRAALSLVLAGLFAGCGGPASPPAAPGGETPSLGSGRQSPAAAPAEPSAEIGLELFRKGDLRGAEPHLAGALKSSPRDRRILEALGAIYERTDRFRQAEESLRAALAIDPASSIAHLGLASVLIDIGRYEEALTEISQARRLDPGNAAALVKGALIETRLGHAEAAAAAARQALLQRPEDAEAHYVLGLALLQQGSISLADGEMREAIRRVPDHLGALSHLVTIAARQGRSDDAEKFRRAHAVALARRRIEERVRGHRLKGVEAFNREDYATALQEFEAIAREDPTDPQVYLHIGSTYAGLGRLDDARAALTRCLALEPRNERALAELGRVHALANRLDEAIAVLEKAIAANPEFAEPHYYLAGIYMARGDRDRSQAETRRFQELQAKAPGSATEVVPGATEPGR